MAHLNVLFPPFLTVGMCLKTVPQSLTPWSGISFMANVTLDLVLAQDWWHILRARMACSFLYRQENPNGRGCFVRLINYMEYKLQSLPRSSINHGDLKASAQPNLKAKNKVNIFEESMNASDSSDSSVDASVRSAFSLLKSRTKIR